jgi:hypothetical protein
VKDDLYAAGTSKNNKNAEANGKSVAGNTTIGNLQADSDGNLVHFEISGGQSRDSKFSVPLIVISDAQYIMADMAYQSKTIREALDAKEIQAAIPISGNTIKKVIQDLKQNYINHVTNCKTCLHGLFIFEVLQADTKGPQETPLRFSV